jgi:hypothetical protein
MNPFCNIFNLFVSVSLVITNGCFCLRASKNTHFLLGGAISSVFKPLPIMHMTKHFTMQILYCLFTIKPSLLSLYTLPPGTAFNLKLSPLLKQIWTKTIMIQKEKKVRMKTNCLNFISKVVGEANSGKNM